jgi:hypothetical protein
VEEERDGAEHGPLNGVEILLKEFANIVEDEDGEGEARMSHGDVKGEPDLGVSDVTLQKLGNCIYLTWRVIGNSLSLSNW